MAYNHHRIVFPNLRRLELDESHASWAAVSMHNEADSIGLDLVAGKELAHIRGSCLEWDPLHLQDALAAKS